MSGHLGDYAVSYNRTVEAAQNRMLMLNVVRASKRRPMYFTGIGSITGAPSYAVNIGGGSLAETSGASPSNTDTFTLPGGSFSNKPTLQIGVFDTHDFIRGILRPVSVETVSHYLRQGWRPDILAYLLIERIEISTSNPFSDSSAGDEAGGTDETRESEASEELGESDGVFVLENDPGDEATFPLFKKIVASLENARCDLKEQVKEAAPIMVLEREPSLGDVAKAYTAGLKLSQVKNGTAVSKERSIWTLHCSAPSSIALSPAYIGQQGLTAAREEDEGGGKLEVAIVLRSPHSVLYYLGEILREIDRRDTGPVQERIPMVPSGQTGEAAGQVPLFWATRDGSTCGRSDLDVEYDDASYIVPGASESDPAAGSTGGVRCFWSGGKAPRPYGYDASEKRASGVGGVGSLPCGLNALPAFPSWRAPAPPG